MAVRDVSLTVREGDLEFTLQRLVHRSVGLHRREEARFRVTIEHDPAGALALARENWKVQREPAAFFFYQDGHGPERLENFLHRHRACAGTAAAVRRRKRLVDVEVHDVEAWRMHYARTTRFWHDRLCANRAAAEREIGAVKTRLWIAYLASASIGFMRNSVGIFQTLASKRVRGPSGLPSSRAFANASSPHGYQSTGFSRCWWRYGLVSAARRLLMLVRSRP